MTQFIYLITYLCIIATFFNDGFTQMFFSIPFILFLLVDSMYAKSRRVFKLNVIAITFLFILALTRFTNPFIYPVLFQERVMQKDYHLTHYPYNTPRLIETKYIKIKGFLSESKDHLEYYKTMNLYKEYLLKKGTLITPIKVIISGHPDIMGIRYDLQIDINDSQLKKEIKKYISSHNKNIKPEINSQYPERMQEAIYIQDYRSNVPNSTDNIIAGDWFFYQKPYNIIENSFGWIVLMFSPMFIWIYLIILASQLYYLKYKYKKSH